MNLESWWRKCGIPYRAAALLGDLVGEVSSQLSLMRSSYYFLTVVPDSRRKTYGGDSCVSDDMESLSKGSVDGDEAHLRIGDTGMGIFLMVPRDSVSSC